MRAQQINRVSGKILNVLSLTALRAVLSGYTQPPQPDEGGTYLPAVSCVASTADRAFFRNGGLEAEFAKRGATIGNSSCHLVSRVWSIVLPWALPMNCNIARCARVKVRL
jgi:hypothetical protein